MSRFLKTYPAFENKTFRLYFLVQSISFVGTWLQTVAQGWLVFEMTHSAFQVGLAAFLMVAPVVVLAPIGGAIADRFEIRAILKWTTWIGFAQATVLGTLFVSGHLSLSLIYALTFTWGIINGFDSPARYTGIVKMVDRELLASAKALNGTLINLGFMLGPIVAGFLIAKVGIGATFFANAVTFLPMIGVLPFLKFRQLPAHEEKLPFKPFANTVDGIRYASSHGTIGLLLLIMGLAMTFGSSYRAILPVIAKEVLHLGPQGFGWLSAAPGLGALIGATLVSKLSKKLPIAILMFSCMVALGGSLVVFPGTGQLASAMVLLAVAGLGLESVIITVQSATAMMSESGMIGRVMGCGASVFFLGMAIGNVTIGYMADRLGSPAAIRWNGCAILVVAAVLFLRRKRFVALLKGSQ